MDRHDVVNAASQRNDLVDAILELPLCYVEPTRKLDVHGTRLEFALSEASSHSFRMKIAQ